MLQIRSMVFNAFSENTYLIINEKKECWIVDPGMYDLEERQLFTDFISREGLSPKAIINTHAHIDHIFGVQHLIETYSIPFALHANEAPVLAGAKGAAMLFGFSMNQVPVPTQVLKAGEDLMLGDDRLELRLAPGHSPGSIVFYYHEGGWAIGGDVLFAGGIGRSDLPGGNGDTLLQSIRTQLYTLPDATIIFPGHGPQTSIGMEKRTNPYVQG